MRFELRQAQVDDRALCLEILHDADEDDTQILAAMLNSTNTTYLARDGESVVGAALVHWDESEAEITHIAVIEAKRGLGYGKVMIEELVRLAQVHPAKAMLVGTANSSISNIVFYQKCGFRMDHVRRDYFAYLPHPVVEDGIPIRDMIVFRLALD